MSPTPRILAAFVQDTLGAVDRADPGLGRSLRERLEPGALTAIESASTIAWLPVELDVALTEALFETAGAATAGRILRDNMIQSFRKPFLRPLIEGALKILGNTPERLLRWAPKAWSLIYRDCGTLAFEPDPERPGRASLAIRELPPVVAESRPYVLGLAAALGGAFALTRGEGTCEVHSRDAGTAIFALRWSAPARERA